MARDYRMISYLGGILFAWFNGMASKKLNVPESALLVAPGVKPCPKQPLERKCFPSHSPSNISTPQAALLRRPSCLGLSCHRRLLHLLFEGVLPNQIVSDPRSRDDDVRAAYKPFTVE